MTEHSVKTVGVAKENRCDTRILIKTIPMTLGLVHELRSRNLNIIANSNLSNGYVGMARKERSTEKIAVELVTALITKH